MGDNRFRAWETRRKKYGPKGHSEAAYGNGIDYVFSMQRLLCKIYVEGGVSEGQVCKATGLHRIEIRQIADDMILNGEVKDPYERP